MQKYVIALYIRLSLEDYKYDSMSIENQHLALNEFISSMSFRSPKAAIDGLWIIIKAVGAILTFVPAMAITEAAEAAIPSILIVTSSL